MLIFYHFPYIKFVGRSAFSPFYPPQSRLNPSQGGSPVTQSMKVGIEEWEPRATQQWNRVILRSLVLSQYQRVTDGHAAYA